MLDDRIQEALHFVEPSHRGKSGDAFFDEELARRAGLDLLEAGHEVVAGHLQRIELRGAGGIIQAKRARGQKAAQGNHADFLAQGFEVGADVAVGSLGDILQVHV